MSGECLSSLQNLINWNILWSDSPGMRDQGTVVTNTGSPLFLLIFTTDLVGRKVFYSSI